MKTPTTEDVDDVWICRALSEEILENFPFSCGDRCRSCFEAVRGIPVTWVVYNGKDYLTHGGRCEHILITKILPKLKAHAS